MAARIVDELSKVDQEALKLLDGAKIRGQKIVKPKLWRVDHESIMFTAQKRPFTAWKSTRGPVEIVRIDPGFVAEF